ncbi:MAG: ABC transporter ATP-binding protein [Pseudomonadales bacterium]|nr:ABC transporter ATP-binding protein [Pseudomonadales bacterium]
MVHAVQGVTLKVEAGKTLAVVGESGCGKSVTAQAIMGLIPVVGGVIRKGSIAYNGQSNIAPFSVDQYAQYKQRIGAGDKVSMIFQDPMNSLNPTLTIGEQISEPLVVHKGLSKKEGQKKAIELLDRVRIPDAKLRVRQYPFEFSGGMLQRAMIAMSLACEPELLIADEPTTALDTTVQDQILSLLSELQQETAMAMIIITHDLGVVARMADHVAVMYAGRVVESGPSASLFSNPSHPYMQGLWQAMPHLDRRQALKPIPGTPPDLSRLYRSCTFAPRCAYRMKVCMEQRPPEFPVNDDQVSSCWLHHDDAPANPLQMMTAGEDNR